MKSKHSLILPKAPGTT